jgi:hypothetical protein
MAGLPRDEVECYLYPMQISYVLRSNVSKVCPFCSGAVMLNGLEDFAGAAKHLQTIHDITPMHVGQESMFEDNECIWTQVLVAVFGSDNPPEPVVRDRTEFDDFIKQRDSK